MSCDSLPLIYLLFHDISAIKERLVGVEASGPGHPLPPNHWPPVMSSPSWPSHGLLWLSRDVLLLLEHSLMKWSVFFLVIVPVHYLFSFFSEITIVQDQPLPNIKKFLWGPEQR
jgi:hypothetical protein